MSFMEFGQGTDLDPVLIDHPNGWKCLYVCIRDEPFLKPVEEEPVSVRLACVNICRVSKVIYEIV
jgi:hypothetical protein